MTNEEAIKKIEKQISYIQPHSFAYRDGHITALNTAVEALEKQIPKPIDWQDRPNRYQENINEPFCPTCGCLVYEDDVYYCSYCGQRLLWERKND